jgi:hypothetical protein
MAFLDYRARPDGVGVQYRLAVEVDGGWSADVSARPRVDPPTVVVYTREDAGPGAADPILSALRDVSAVSTRQTT